ncbi:MAG: protein translocase subunit SecDF [Flavobacteriales bacterium]
MRNKGFFTAILLILTTICFYYFGKTFYAQKIESEAKAYASVQKDGDIYVDPIREKKYLDSIAIVDSAGFFTYKDARKDELNLGLDLKGGINVILEVSEKDIIIDLANYSQNPVFLAALKATDDHMKNSQETYRDLFFQNFQIEKQKAGSSVNLASSQIFGNAKMGGIISTNTSDADVQKEVSSKIRSAVSDAKRIIEQRIDKFGVAQPVVQQIENTGRIIVELPGVQDTERVKKLLQSTAKLEFWKLDSNTDVFFKHIESLHRQRTTSKIEKQEVKDSITPKNDSIKTSSLEDKANTTVEIQATEETKPLFVGIQAGSGQALANVSDTATINQYLKSSEARQVLTGRSRYDRFVWDAKPLQSNPDQIYLYALEGNRQGKATLSGDVVQTASNNRSQYGQVSVDLRMTTLGAKEWAKVTKANIGNQLAIVLDNQVYSAPVIRGEMNTGTASITGQFSDAEAKDLADILNAGKLPASAKIIQAEVVGPSLGQEAIDSGLMSFALALIVVILWMIFYYAGAGIIADISLAANLVFMLGVLISIHGVLTLPGIAGIVLTIGMAVDANVLIFDRIREELYKGKDKQQAIKDGYSFALSSIIDANITTFLTAIILGVFGSGPIKGFAVTLGIGIITSLISSLILSRLLIELFPKTNFSTSVTKNWFMNMTIDFLGKRKIAYILSGGLVLVGLASLITRGLDLGVDFVGGRTYTIQLEKETKSDQLVAKLTTLFVDSDGKTYAPEIKTLGTDNKIKITTKYMIDENDDTKVDEKIFDILYAGIKDYLPANMSREAFAKGGETKKYGVLSYNKVGPTIADDIKQEAFLAVGLSLAVIFLYILARFRKWQFSTGAVIAVFHDVLLVLGIFSLTKDILPFSLEIDQAFIAAILTVIGYSLNDTVVVFDRIREHLYENKTMPFGQLTNKALNDTLSRTVNTSFTTLIVLLIIFFFGGDTIKGFMFALIVGVVIGTYSSLFVASPITYDLARGSLKNRKA